MQLFRHSYSTLVIIGGCILLLVSFGIRHSSGLYLIPISEHIQTGREVFGFAIAIQFLMIGIGSPIFGAIADKYGGHKAISLAFIFYIIGVYFLYSGPNTGIYFQICLKWIVHLTNFQNY